MAAYTTITKKEKKKERKAWYLKHSLSYFLKENDTRINDTYTHRRILSRVENSHDTCVQGIYKY